MPSVLAIVSKPLFEEAARAAKVPFAIGGILGLDRYLSVNKALDGLSDGGTLFLVTVRSDGGAEALWLVGALEKPERRSDGWYALKSPMPITDISGLRERLKFTSGKGMSMKAGALAMSLQTPRELTAEDLVALRATMGAVAKPVAAPSAVRPIKVTAVAPQLSVAPKTTPGRSVADLFVKTRESIVAHELGNALTLLLRAWRVKPASSLADAIDAVGARAAAELSPPTGKTPKARNQAWADRAVAGDPIMRGVLLGCLTETKGSAETMERIELLVPHLPDPRVSSRIAALAEVPMYNASVSRTAPFWRRLFDLLPTLGDPRIGLRANDWVGIWASNKELNDPERPELKKRLDKIRAQLDVAMPVLGDEEAAALDAVVAALGGTKAPPPSVADEARLLAAIWADPGNDAPKFVYGDWLQERGDPRGEFIALQMARADGTQTAQQAKREHELEAEFGERWLGPLKGKLLKSELTFARGFVSAGVASAAIDGEPAWSTLTEVARQVPLPGAHVPLLRKITEVTNGGIEALARHTEPLAVEEIDWHGPQYFKRGAFNSEGMRAIAAYQRTLALPRLRRLTLRGSSSWLEDAVQPHQLAWTWTSPAGAALKEILFPARINELERWIEALSATQLEAAIISSGAENRWGYTALTKLTRDNDGHLTRAEMFLPHHISRIEVSQYAEQLASLPPTLLTAVKVVAHEVSWKLSINADDLPKAIARQKRVKSHDIELVGRMRLP